jgi:segregation and condensation protein A
MQDKIYDMLLKEEDVTWKSLIYELVKSEQMNPWDINLTTLTQKYIQLIKDMKEHDLKISGKILLAAAILLKIKSTHFIETDIANLDRMMNPVDDELSEEDLFDEMEQEMSTREKQKFKLIPRNPQPRSRKVSIHDLVDALQRAMETKKRALVKQRPVKYNFPKRKFDIMEVIQDIYHKISYYTTKKSAKSITFSQLLPPKAGKQEKVHTFIPLLHLENQRKIDTTQKKSFDEIHVKLINSKKK